MGKLVCDIIAHKRMADTEVAKRYIAHEKDAHTFVKNVANKADVDNKSGTLQSDHREFKYVIPYYHREKKGTITFRR